MRRYFKRLWAAICNKDFAWFDFYKSKLTDGTITLYGTEGGKQVFKDGRRMS